MAPQGLSEVTTMACGTCSIENALKCAMIWYRNKQRGTTTPDPEDMKSCMVNEPPGSPQLSILSFHGKTHSFKQNVSFCA